jgi:hypothetical protein
MSKRIKKYEGFINENSYVDEFKILYDKAPQGLQKIIDATKDIKQSPQWHPEGDVHTHIRLVTNRLHNTFNDINLTLAGLFHDLGKVRTTEWDEEKQKWTAHGHEDDSKSIAHSYSDWIKKLGGDTNIIEFIIQNHMRIKYLDDFRLQEKIAFTNHPLFDWVHKFMSADYGGNGLECKPLTDISHIEKEISEHNKREKENKIISSKFNGKILMDLYPELKGKSLGDAITGFKRHIGDFREYALNTSKEDILKDFKVFYLN